MMKSQVRWGRVMAAALFSELGVIAVLLAASAVHALLIAPGRSATEYQAFGRLAGYYVAPPASGLATFLFVLWLSRRLSAHFTLNGTLTGMAAAILASGFLFTARPEDRLMYFVSFALRIAGGYLGGVVAQSLHRRGPGYEASSAVEAGSITAGGGAGK